MPTEAMKRAFLEVTFRRRRPLAAYHYLPREDGARTHRTEDAGQGMMVDYAESGRPIGIQVTRPASVSLAALNRLLRRRGHAEIREGDLASLAAA